MLRLVLPKGSLEKATLELFAAADLAVVRGSDVDYRGTHRRPPGRRGPHPAAPGDPDLRGRGPLRPRDHRPRLDRGDRRRRRLARGAAPTRRPPPTPSGSCWPWPRTRRSTTVEDLPAGARVSTEYPELTRRCSRSTGVKAEVRLSYGATEAKIPDIADAVVEITETGRALAAAGLRIVETLLDVAHRADRQPAGRRRSGQAPRHGPAADPAAGRARGPGQGARQAERRRRRSSSAVIAVLPVDEVADGLEALRGRRLRGRDRSCPSPRSTS